jgi:hypothetical protein
MRFIHPDGPDEPNLREVPPLPDLEPVVIDRSVPPPPPPPIVEGELPRPKSRPPAATPVGAGKAKLPIVKRKTET